jgi:hypothetical protein
MHQCRLTRHKLLKVFFDVGITILLELAQKGKSVITTYSSTKSQQRGKEQGMKV